MSYTTKYDFATIVFYPELKTYLIQKLQELDLKSLSVINTWNADVDEGCYNVSLEFNQPQFVKDWTNYNDNKNCLHINSDAGGTFCRNISVNCRIAPSKNSNKAVFTIELSLDSRFDTDIEFENSLRLGIDKFVEKCKNGFVYHFKKNDLWSGYRKDDWWLKFVFYLWFLQK